MPAARNVPKRKNGTAADAGWRARRFTLRLAALQRHDMSKYRTCPYNALHIFKVADIDEHVRNCPDKETVTIRDYGYGPVAGTHRHTASRRVGPLD